MLYNSHLFPPLFSLPYSPPLSSPFFSFSFLFLFLFFTTISHTGIFAHTSISFSATSFLDCLPIIQNSSYPSPSASASALTSASISALTSATNSNESTLRSGTLNRSGSDPRLSKLESLPFPQYRYLPSPYSDAGAGGSPQSTSIPGSGSSSPHYFGCNSGSGSMSPTQNSVSLELFLAIFI